MNKKAFLRRISVGASLAFLLGSYAIAVSNNYNLNITYQGTAPSVLYFIADPQSINRNSTLPYIGQFGPSGNGWQSGNFTNFAYADATDAGSGSTQKRYGVLFFAIYDNASSARLLGYQFWNVGVLYGQNASMQTYAWTAMALISPASSGGGAGMQNCCVTSAGNEYGCGDAPGAANYGWQVSPMNCSAVVNPAYNPNQAGYQTQLASLQTVFPQNVSTFPGVYPVGSVLEENYINEAVFPFIMPYMPKPDGGGNSAGIWYAASYGFDPACSESDQGDTVYAENILAMHNAGQSDLDVLTPPVFFNTDSFLNLGMKLLCQNVTGDSTNFDVNGNSLCGKVGGSFPMQTPPQTCHG